MKLTKQKLYDLILEQLSQKELNYFAGKDIPQFKNMVNNPSIYADYSKPHDEISKQWIDNNIGEKLGSGYSRMVFEFGDNKVIKFAYGSAMQDGKASNLVEAKLFNQFPKLFPKAYAHDPDGAWVIVDKVDIIDTRDEFYAILPIQFPVINDMIKVLQQGAPRHDEDLNPYFLWLLLSKVLSYDFKEPSPMVYFLQHFRKYYSIPIPVSKKAWELMTRDSNLMYWAGTLKNLRVNLSDIRHGNVGWSGDRMVILDISIFEQDLTNARHMLKWGEHWNDEDIKIRPQDFGSKQQLTPDGAKGDVFKPIPPNNPNKQIIPTSPFYDHSKKDITRDKDYKEVSPGVWRKVK